MTNLNLMGPVGTGKVIPRAFKSIGHLSGSKMIDDRDHLIGEQIEKQMTTTPRIDSQLVFASEKLDGMCVAVYKHEGKLYPISRKGYDVRTSEYEWIRKFGDYVEMHAQYFNDLLHEDERVTGEWLIKTHTVRYQIENEPFVIFDMIRGNGADTYHYQTSYITNHLMATAMTHGESYPAIEYPKIINVGKILSPAKCIENLSKWHETSYPRIKVIGPIPNTPEGIVLRLEENDGVYVAHAKYVSHPYLGKAEHFKANEPVYNILPERYRWLYPKDAVVPELGIGV